MNRRILSLLLAVLMLGQLTAAVLADGAPPSSAAAYYLDGTLYAFARFPGYEDEEDLQVGLMVNGVQIGSEQSAKKLTAGEAPAPCMLLVDCSTSMPDYMDRLLALGDALMASDVPMSVTVASFGEAFRVVAGDLRDRDSLRSALESLNFGEQGTDICGGAAYAVDYMRDEVWQPGQLASVILVTDGIPFYSHEDAIEVESEASAAAALQAVLAESPQVLFHSVCFEDWERVTYDAVSSGFGYHLTAPDAGTAGKAGETVADYYGSLYGLSFPLEEYSDNLSLKISNTEFTTIDPVRDLTVPEDDSVFEDIPVVIDTEDPEGPEQPETPEAPEPPEPSPEVTTPPEEIPAESPAPAEEPAEPQEAEPAPEESEEASSPEPEAEPAPEETPEINGLIEENPQKSAGISPLMIGLLAGISLLLIVLAVVLIVLVQKRKKPAADQTGPSAPGPVPMAGPVGIPLRLQVIYGAAQTQARQFQLTESLLVGSDGRCDLVLAEPSVAPVHARIFLQNGTVMIEDLNSAGGTALGGMRIYAPNRLPSGEQIQIGQCVISFFY